MEAFARDGRVTSAFRPIPLEKASDLDWPALSLTEVFPFARFHISLHHLQFASVHNGLGARFHFEVVLRMMGCLKFAPPLPPKGVFVYRGFFVLLQHLQFAIADHGLSARFHFEVALRMKNCLKSHRSSRRRAFFSSVRNY